MSSPDDSSESDVPTLGHHEHSPSAETIHTIYHSSSSRSPTDQINVQPNSANPIEENGDIYYKSFSNAGNHNPSNFLPRIMNEESEATPLLRSRSPASNQFSAASIEIPIQDVWSVYSMLSNTYKFLADRPYGLSIFVLLVVLILGTGYFVLTNLETAIRESVNFYVDELSVLNFNENGVSLHIAAYASCNYEMISSSYLRRIIQMGAIVIGGITTNSNGKIRVFMKVPNDSLRHVFDLDLPRLDIDLLNNHMTFIDFNQDVEIIEAGMAITLNKIMTLASSNESAIPIQIRGIGNLQVRNPYLNFGSHEFDITETLILNNAGVPQFEFKEFSVKDLVNGSGILSSISIEFENNYPLKLTLPSVSWDFSINGCGSKKIYMGSGLSETLVIGPSYPITCNVSATIRHLSQEYFKKCDNGYSPIEAYANRVLSQENITIIVQGSKQQSDALPGWLRYVLSRTELPVTVVIPSILEDHDYLRREEFQDLNIVLPKSTVASVYVDSNVSVYAEIPSILSVLFNIPRIKGDLEVWYNNTPTGALIMDNWQSSRITKLADELRIDLSLYDTEVVVYDPKLMGILLNEYLSGVESILELRGNLDLQLLTSIEDGILNGLRLPSVAFSFPGGSDSFLTNITSKIYEISYIQSETQSLVLKVLCEILNPLNISVVVDKIDLSIGFNSTIIGHATIQELQINAGEYFNTTIQLELGSGFYGSETDGEIIKENLEVMLSSYLSGNDPEVQISGHNGSVESSPILSQLISELSVDLKLPPYSLSIADSIFENGDVHDNGFILDATMHIMTSEVEFTVFNPISNAEVLINIYKGQASYEGTVLGYIDKPTLLMIPPGMYTTPRIPITYSNGIGGNILKKALNGNLKVQGMAVFGFRLGNYELDLFYRGKGLNAKIRL